MFVAFFPLHSHDRQHCSFLFFFLSSFMYISNAVPHWVMFQHIISLSGGFGLESAGIKVTTTKEKPKPIPRPKPYKPPCSCHEASPQLLCSGKWLVTQSDDQFQGDLCNSVIGSCVANWLPEVHFTLCFPKGDRPANVLLVLCWIRDFCKASSVIMF